MKKEQIAIFFIIIFFGLSLFTSLLFIPSMEVSAQTFNCVVGRDVDIPYQYEYFSTRILANAKFEIKFTIRDNSDEKVYVKLVPGEPDPNDPAVTVDVDEKTLTYLLGSGLYGSTKTDYERLGSSNDDYEIPGLREMFFQAAILDEDWIYDYDAGNARITDITISSDQARIKYLEFWDNEFRDANMHEDSQDFEDFSDLDDADWESLRLNTGAPTIINNEDVLYLTTPYFIGSRTASYPLYYPLPYYSYPTYYGSLYPSYSGSPINVYNYYYGNYPGGSYSSYPGGSFASFRGNLPSTFYQGYSSLYPGSYTGSFRNLLGSYPGTYGFGTYSFTNPAGGFGGYTYGFPSFVSSRNIYGFGYPPYGGFVY